MAPILLGGDESGLATTQNPHISTGPVFPSLPLNWKALHRLPSDLPLANLVCSSSFLQGAAPSFFSLSPSSSTFRRLSPPLALILFFPSPPHPSPPSQASLAGSNTSRLPLSRRLFCDATSRRNSRAPQHLAQIATPQSRLILSAKMSSYIDYSKTTKSSNYQGTGSFATFMIIARKPCPPTSFPSIPLAPYPLHGLSLTQPHSRVFLPRCPLCLIPIRFSSPLDEGSRHR